MSDAITETTSKTLLDANTSTLLTFTVAGQTYGLPVTYVVRIIEMVTITQLPDVHETIQGIINLQGKAVPVMDLRHRFGLPHKSYGLHTPIILANVDGSDRMLGLIVDAVEDVLEITAENLEVTETIVSTELAGGMAGQPAPLAGVAKVDRQMILVLNVSVLMSQTEHVKLSQALGLDSGLDGREKSSNNRQK
jgi:purine-binding chemotaxis protein CheW